MERVAQPQERRAEKLLKPLGFLLLVSGLGAGYFHYQLGMSWIAAWYQVVITMSTVGFGAPPGLDDGARLVISILIPLGVGTAAYVVGLIIAFIVEGELIDILEERKMKKEISSLSNHVIVAGVGRIGRLVATELLGQGRRVVCIDRDTPLLIELRRQGMLTIQGDATEESVLETAGIHRASVLACTLASDAETVFLTLTARFLNENIKIVARGSDEVAERKLRRAGANVVILPNLIGSRRMTQAITQPNVLDFVDLTTGRGNRDLRLDEVRIGDSFEYVGMPLQETDLRQKYGLIIVAIRKSDGVMQFNPSGTTVVDSGDILVALGEASWLDELKSMAGG